MLELGNFLDTFHDGPPEAMKLYDEGEQQALDTLEDAWFGRDQVLEPRADEGVTGESPAAGELAEQSSQSPGPSSGTRMRTTKRYAAQQGLTALPF